MKKPLPGLRMSQVLALHVVRGCKYETVGVSACGYVVAFGLQKVLDVTYPVPQLRPSMKKVFASLVAAACIAGTADAQVLDFEGIGNNNSIGNYYDGGFGPNFGIEFFGNALAIESGVGRCQGTGNFALQPSGCGVLYFLTSNATGMNRASGFTTGFSLFYSAAFNAGSLEVWSGLNGTGSLLASLNLPVTGDGAGNPSCLGTNFCPWTPVGVTFSGTAQSILFAGVANQIGFDDVTFGSSTPGTVVPEPSTYALMAAGLAALGFASRRRRPAQV